MDKGVKKIKWNSGLAYPKLSQPGAMLVVVPDQYVYFGVAEWHPGTTPAEKNKEITWMRQSADRKVILSQMTIPPSKDYGLKIPKKLCGDFSYYIEASLSGKRDKVATGLLVKGFCPPKVTTSKWSTQAGGNSINNKKGIIKYGHIVHLNLQTEGLNYQTLVVEVYNRAGFGRDDKKICVYTNVACVDGEVDLEIRNTFGWMAKIDNLRDDEDFYVKVKGPNGKYIVDNQNKDKLAVYLKVYNEVVTTNVDVSRNNKPAKVGEAVTNPVRFEPCKFNRIKITEIKTEDGTASPVSTLVFDEGTAKMNNSSGDSQRVDRSIYYDFDKSNIRGDAQNVLSNILQFLLEHPGATMNLDAHADDRGTDEYNMKLSQRRADTVKKYFADGGLDGKRIVSVGHGERQLRIKGKHLTEDQHQQNRRTDISFVFKNHGGNSIIYETVAPGESIKKELIMVVEGFDTQKCFTKQHNGKKVILKNVGQQLDKGDKETIVQLDASNTIKQKVYSDLWRFNAYPFQYIWPKATTPNAFWYYINSCRYYTEPKRPTVIVNVYPDIKWEIAFELKIKVENYAHTNMPAGSIFAKHQEKAREAGYERWLMNENGEVPISIGFALKAEWNAGKQKQNFTKDFKTKIETFAKVLSRSAELAQDAINVCRGLAKSTSIPVSFGVEYPKFEAVGSWKLEKGEKQLQVAILGEISFAAKPLIGANVTIDLVAAAVAVASYATTGSPAIAKIVERIRELGKHVGAELTADAKIYGELEVIFTALKINSITGIEGGSLKIGGKMGLKITIELKVGVSKSKKKTPIIAFNALGRATGDAYFGGEMKLDSDNKGLYAEPTLKFSGLKVTFEGEITVGWFKRGISVEDVLVPESVIKLEKNYIP